MIICVLFICSVSSIICYFISISNYRRSAWEAEDFLAAFHIVFVTYVYICLYMYTCIVENKIFFFFFFFLDLISVRLALDVSCSLIVKWLPVSHLNTGVGN